MDRRLTLRFYEVGKLKPTGPSLADVLDEIYALGTARTREADVAADCRVRLERLAKDNGHVVGEFTRVQSTNFPSEVRDGGVFKLGVNGQLGHGIAFRFRPKDHILAIQYDSRVLSPGRIFSYLLEVKKDAAFELTPCMNDSAWERLDKRPLKKLKIRVASPADLANVEDEGAAVGESFRALGLAYGAPSVTIEIGMGGKNGSLSDTAKTMARQVFELFANDEIDLRGMRAICETQDGERNDEINLIDEILSVKDELVLPDNDPDKSYEMRRKWLKDKMAKHV